MDSGRGGSFFFLSTTPLQVSIDSHIVTINAVRLYSIKFQLYTIQKSV